MNRYDHAYRGMQRGLPAPFKVSVEIRQTMATAALAQHRFNGFGPDDDDELFRQFDYADTADYWDAALSQPMKADAFAHLLDLHWISAHQPVDVQGAIKRALRLARLESERWFIEDLAHPPKDRADLSNLQVQPLAAARWMAEKPRQKHLIPPSLVSFLERSEHEAPAAPPVDPKSGAPGRPTSRQIVEVEMRRRASVGEMTSPLSDEARILSAWLKRTHPTISQMTAKTIQNSLLQAYKDARNLFPK